MSASHLRSDRSIFSSYSFFFQHPCRDTIRQLLLIETRGVLILVQSESRLDFVIQYCSQKEFLKFRIFRIYRP